MKARSFCRICEVGCGAIVEMASGRMTVGPDPDNPYSQGYFCRKGRWGALVETDPDRLTRPLMRRGEELIPASWEDALGEAGRKLRAVADRHGRQAIAVFSGNSAAYSGHLTLAVRDLMEGIGTDTLFTALSVDCMARYHVAAETFNLLYVVPVPVYDRVPGVFLIGSNATVSQWSPGGAHPGGAKVAADMRRRGGWIAVADPVRHQIADMADTYLRVRPGTDAALLAGLLAFVWREGFADRAYVERYCAGLAQVVEACRDVSIADAAEITSVPEARLHAAYEELARRRAVVLDRGGVGMSRHSTVLSGLALAVNASLGRIDVADGLFLPADSSVRGSLPRGRPKAGRYGREWPSALFARAALGEFAGAGEVAVPEIKALIVIGGNPARSLPNTARVERALQGLEALVVIDIYPTETSRFAHVVLPGSAPYQRADFNFLGAMLTPEGYRIWSDAALPLRDQQRQELWTAERLAAVFRGETPEAAVARPDRSGDHLAEWVKLSPEWYGGMVSPKRSGGYLKGGFPTASGRMEFDRPWIAGIPHALKDARTAAQCESGALRIAGRRLSHAVNSFLHNVPEATRRGNPVLVAPADAVAHNLETGDEVVLEGSFDATTSTVAISDRVPPGTVVLAHGWDHRASDLANAKQASGGNANALTSDEDLDLYTGMPVYHGYRVKLRKPGP